MKKNEENNTTTKPSSDMKHLYNTRKSLQKARIAVGNRVSAIERGVDENENPTSEIYTTIEGVLAEAEDRITAEMARLLRGYPVWDAWLKHVKGIGPSLASQLLAITSVLSPVEHSNRGVSIWYKAYGLIPEEVEDKEGNPIMHLPRPTKGAGKITYHPGARTLLYNIGQSFIKTGAGGYYRDVYDKAKNTLTYQHRDDPKNWTKGRIDSVARWMAVKRFLSHLWEMWLRSEGLTPRVPYAVEKLGHSYQAPPEPRKDGKKI